MWWQTIRAWVVSFLFSVLQWPPMCSIPHMAHPNNNSCRVCRGKEAASGHGCSASIFCFHCKLIINSSVLTGAGLVVPAADWHGCLLQILGLFWSLLSCCWHDRQGDRPFPFISPQHFTEFLDEFSTDVLGQLLNDPFLSEKNEVMEVELSPASPAPLIQAEHSYSLCGDSRPQSPLTHISTDDNFNEGNTAVCEISVDLLVRVCLPRCWSNAVFLVGLWCTKGACESFVLIEIPTMKLQMGFVWFQSAGIVNQEIGP